MDATPKTCPAGAKTGGEYLHPPSDFGSTFHDGVPRTKESRRLAALLVLDALVMAGELVGGLLTGSTALVADSGHMLSHVVALGLAWLAIAFGRRGTSPDHTYGWPRAEVLAAFTNGIAILFVVVWIAAGAVSSLIAPRPILVREMLLVAGVGLAANLAGAWLLAGHAARDLNIRGAYLHLLADTLSSVAVVVGGVAILWTGWLAIDGALALVIALVVLAWGVGLVRQSARILLEGVPEGLDLSAVCEAIRSVKGVRDVHDAHLWALAPDRRLMTAHLQVVDGTLLGTSRILDAVNALLHERFQIGHTTFQLEALPEEQRP